MSLKYIPMIFLEPTKLIEVDNQGQQHWTWTQNHDYQGFSGK